MMTNLRHVFIACVVLVAVSVSVPASAQVPVTINICHNVVTGAQVPDPGIVGKAGVMCQAVTIQPSPAAPSGPVGTAAGANAALQDYNRQRIAQQRANADQRQADALEDIARQMRMANITGGASASPALSAEDIAALQSMTLAESNAYLTRFTQGDTAACRASVPSPSVFLQEQRAAVIEQAQAKRDEKAAKKAAKSACLRDWRSHSYWYRLAHPAPCGR